ncbi:MFS transporter [Aeromonas veronii]|uniref:MFS transporter n=1 Tax=Aeromonas veronii TaxID=654 RepID=UPI0024414854|nr:MFS transporter [Aeromonas veronii]
MALLIAAEFMPVSLLTPIATDLGASNGMAGLAIAISGLFAVPTSLLIALSPNFTVLMVARALLGIVIGGFWALATATIMRLVGSQSVPKALGILYTGNAVATAFAAPIGSYLGGLIGWRGVFWLLVPLGVINLLWMVLCLPSMHSQARPQSAFRLMRRPNIVIAIIGVTLTFAGAFSAFTYFRPFLETRTLVDLPQLSALLLALGLAGFAGTTAVSLLLHRHLYRMLRWLPLVLGVITLALLTVAHHFWGGGPDADPLGDAQLRHSGRLVRLDHPGHRRHARERRWSDGRRHSAIHHIGGRRGGLVAGLFLYQRDLYGQRPVTDRRLHGGRQWQPTKARHA